MRLLRSFRVKTLVIVLPFVLVFFLLQNQQIPTLSKFVPSVTKPVEDGYRHQLMSGAPPPPQHTISSVTTVPGPVKKPSQTEVSDQPPTDPKPAVEVESKPTSTASPDTETTIPPSSQATLSDDSSAASTASKANTETEASPQPSSQATLSGDLSSSGSNSTEPRKSVSQANEHAFRKSQIEFWKSLESLLDSSKPDCDTPKRLGRAKAAGFNPSGSERPKHLEMPKDDVEKMRKAHAKFVQGIREDSPQLVYTPGSQGLVSTGGGKYLPVFVISLRMLRRTGTTLPVEVFLADHEEYEEHICKEVLPSLNATCVIMSDILTSVPHDVEITKYQFKVFAMIFSSFEEILFLDADAFPIHNPEELFSSDLFQEYGLITWPDFWASSTSEYYYTIAQQSIPPMEERASSETGELLISKKSHQQFLLLATYYNYYGPTHYYLLLSQGSPGEGDKDTFLPAAKVFNQTFYATSESVKPIGHPKPDHSIAGSAMVQFDPIQDHNLTRQGLWRVKDHTVAASPRPFFIHANFPKFNPATIFHLGGPARDENGTDRKSWTVGDKTMEAFGFDVEKDFWTEIKWVACTLEKEFATWKDEKDICRNTTAHWDSLYGDK